MWTTSSRRSRRLSYLIPAIAVALGLSSCGGGGSDAGSDEGPAGLAPADSLLYAEVVVQPEGDQLEAVNSIFARFAPPELGVSSPFDALEMAIDESAAEAEAPFTYAEDIEPWLGERAGGFISGVDEEGNAETFGIIVETDDSEAAQTFLDELIEFQAAEAEAEQAEYNGSSYYVIDEEAVVGLVGDFLVFGTQAGFEAAVDSSGGDSLPDSEGFGDAISEVGEDPIASAYVDAQAFIDLAIASGELVPEELEALETFTGGADLSSVYALSVDDESLSFDVATAAPEGATITGSDLFESLPGDAIFAFALSDLGAQLSSVATQLEGALGEAEAESGLDLTSILGSIGDVGGFVSGTTPLDVRGGVIVETSEADSVASALETLQPALGEEGVLEESDSGGFSFTPEDSPQPIEVEVGEDRIVVGFGSGTAATLLDPESSIEDSEAFGDASDGLGDDFDPLAFADLGQLGAFTDLLAADSEDAAAVTPYLESLAYVIAGTKVDDDRQHIRLVLGLTG